MEAQTKIPGCIFHHHRCTAKKDKDGEAKIEDNVLSIMYAEEQADILQDMQR